MCGNLENIKLLIKKDIFSLKDKDNNDETPFMIACNNFNLAKYFIMELNYELSKEELMFLEKQKNVFNKPVEPIIEMYRKKQLSDKLNINLKENINKSIKPKI